MATSALREHLVHLKKDSEELLKLVSSGDYRHEQVYAYVKPFEPFKMPEVSSRQTNRSHEPKSTLQRKEPQPQPRSRQSSEYQSKNTWSLQKEIISLRNQNVRLQHNISSSTKELISVKEEISRMRHKEMTSSKNRKEVPYFSLSEEIDVYITRSPVPEESYDELEYEESQVELSEESLRIQQGEVERVFDLKHLSHVDYYDSIMIFRFEPKKYWVLLNFASLGHETEAKWDLGLFVNWKIAHAPDSKRLFANEFSGRSRKKSYRFSLPISEKTAQYQESIDEEEQDLPRIKFSQVADRPEKPMAGKQLFPSSNIYIQEESSKQILPDPMETQQSQVSPVPSTIQGFLANDFTSPIQNLTFSQNPFKQLPKQPSAKQSPVATQQTILKSLSKGYILVKHAKGGISSHQKIVSLIPQTMQLRFQDMKSRDVKVVEMKNIRSIKQRVLGEGILKHNKTINPNLCVVMQLKDGKVIELTGPSEELVDSFAGELKFVLEKIFNKKLDE